MPNRAKGTHAPKLSINSYEIIAVAIVFQLTYGKNGNAVSTSPHMIFFSYS